MVVEMKKIVLVIILIFLFSGLAYGKEAPNEGINKASHKKGSLTTESNVKDDDLSDKAEHDEEYRQSIVGYWVGSNETPYATGVFKADGINRVIIYESINSKNLIARIEANWWIKNGRLFSKLTKMDTPQPDLIRWHVMEDQIVEINDKRMVLIDEYGREEINYRNEDTHFDQLWSESEEVLEITK